MVFGGWIGCTTELWPTSTYIMVVLCYSQFIWFGSGSKTPSTVSLFWFIFSLLYLCFPAEYYDNGHCHACHSTCETCKGPTEGDCLTCASPLLLQGDKCVNTCDEGFYMEAGICAKCLHTCTQCVSRMNCTGCAKGLQLQSGECRTTCAEGWVIKNARRQNHRGLDTWFHFVFFLFEAVCPRLGNRGEGLNGERRKAMWKLDFDSF